MPPALVQVIVHVLCMCFQAVDVLPLSGCQRCQVSHVPVVFLDLKPNLPDVFDLRGIQHRRRLLGKYKTMLYI